MGSIKQVIVVRSDLEMGKGKVAAQVAHASVLGAENVRKSHSDWLDGWVSGGQEKIVVKVANLKELQQIQQHAFSLNLPCSEVEDAGRTQIKAGTLTCISIGPAPKEIIDKVTGDLKLL